MQCTERDHIILAFALAVNEKNIAAEEGETARSESARQNAKNAATAAGDYSFTLRSRILDHCRQHGC